MCFLLHSTPFSLANSLGLAGNEAPVRPEGLVAIESPSYADHNVWTTALAQAIQDSAAINDFFAGMQGGPSKAGDDARVAVLADEPLLRIAQTFPRNIGRVCVSSGMLDTLDSRRLDWALVELTAPQFAGDVEYLSNVGAKHYSGSDAAANTSIETPRTPARLPFAEEV